MINLLPPEAKQAVRREYWARVLGAWALLSAAACFVCALLLLPTHVLLSRQLNAVASEIVAREDAEEAAQYAVVQADVRAANELAVQLAKEAPPSFATVVMPTLERARPVGLTLTAVLYSADAQQVRTIEVRGIAATRATLVTFVEALKRDPRVAEASVPVGDLARERQLPFTISLMLAATEH